MLNSIRLLGSLSIEEKDGRTAKIQQSARGSALLAYLVYSGETHSREELADLLWESTSTRQSLHRLRELLSRIRKVAPEIDATRKTIRFHNADHAFIDLVALRAGLYSDSLSAKKEALQHYRGDFLGTFYLDGNRLFNEWLLVTREQIRQQVITAYQQLCQAYGDHQQWVEAAEAAYSWIKIDNLNEDAYRYRMTALAQSGQIKEALALYDHLCHYLLDELAIEPATETAQLAQEIKSWPSSVDIRPTQTLNKILKEPSLADLGGLPANSYLPYRRNDDFIGREAQLQKIAHSLGEAMGEGRPAVVAITGMGGVGKTQTAVEFCYRYGRYFAGGVFWLNFADGENVLEELSRIGSQRGIGVFQDSDQLSLKDRVDRVQKAWQEPIPRLLIFDNCEDEALLKRWAPVSGGCSILVTSRREKWERELAVKAISLEGLTSQESIALLQQATPRFDSDSAGSIAAEVGHLPLALHMIGGFLRRYTQISPHAYLAQLQSKNILEHPSLNGYGLSHSPTDHDLHIARTFAISFAQLDLAREVDRMAQQLLAHVTCFAPGEPIASDLLQMTVFENRIDDLAQILLYSDGLNRLLELGFLRVNGNMDTIVMHRLLNTYISRVLQEERVGALTAVEDTMEKLLTDIWEQRATAQELQLPISHLRYITYAAIDRQDPQAHRLANHLAWVDILAM